MEQQQQQQQQQQQHVRVVVLDNGAGSIKLGYGGEDDPRLVFPNCTAKAKGERALYVGDALLAARELGGLVVRRPHDRGFLINADLERDIWAKGFSSLAASQAPGKAPAAAAAAGSRSKAVLEYGQCGLLLTEPLFNFDAVRAATEEIAFEEFGFASLLAAPAPQFALQHACRLPPAPTAVPRAPGGAAAPQAVPGELLLSARDAAAPQAPLAPAALAAATAAKAAGAGVVLDAGFSAVTAVPFYNGQVLLAGVRRLNLGGKALTNLLKETASYRSLNVSDEPLLVERVKEQLCWVSPDAVADLRAANPAARSPHRREVVLPDGVHNLHGYVRPPPAALLATLRPGGRHHAAGVALGPWPAKPKHLQELDAAREAKEAAAAAAAAGGSGKGGGGGGGGAPGGGGKKGPQDQVLSLNNELFMAPEALFRPSDIGLQQAGAPELVQQAVAACPAGLAPLLYGQIVLAGGCANLPGFVRRFCGELRALVPNDLEVVVVAPPAPELAAWRGAAAFAAGDAYWRLARTRRQYEEEGPAAAGGGRR